MQRTLCDAHYAAAAIPTDATPYPYQQRPAGFPPKRAQRTTNQPTPNPTTQTEHRTTAPTTAQTLQYPGNRRTATMQDISFGFRPKHLTPPPYPN